MYSSVIVTCYETNFMNCCLQDNGKQLACVDASDEDYHLSVWEWEERTITQQSKVSLCLFSGKPKEGPCFLCRIDP